MRTRRNFLIAMVLVLFLVGTIGSVGVARQVARADSKTSHQEFVATAANIASTLKLALQHEQDLTISAGAFFSGDPDATQSAFEEWTKSVRAFARYPELVIISK